MKSSRVFEPIIYALLLGAGMLLGRYSGGGSYSGDESRLMEALKIIENQYVDTVSMEELSSLALEDVMQKLDPHSVFIAASEKAHVNAPLDGNFQGIGIEFNQIRDTVFVMRVMAGGPADKAGIKVADRLLSANKKSLIGLEFEAIAGLIKGEKGTKVALEVLTPQGKIITKTPIRGVVDIPSVPAYYMMNDSMAFLKLDQFSATTTEEFKNAITKLNEEGMKGLILDLRNNTGGYLEAAINLLDEFIDDRKVLTYTAGKTEPKKEYFSSAGGMCTKTRLTVLVNGNSASASELFCGAIQDYNRGKVIGVKTYGKGLVQENFTLSDGSLLRLTVARYYTPKGRSIQKSYDGFKSGQSSEKKGGITPDIMVESTDSVDAHADLWEFDGRKVLIRILETQSARLSAFKSSEAFEKDPQLRTAVQKGLTSITADSERKKWENEIVGSVIRSFLGDAEAIKWKNRADRTVLTAQSVLFKS